MSSPEIPEWICQKWLSERIAPCKPQRFYNLKRKQGDPAKGRWTSEELKRFADAIDEAVEDAALYQKWLENQRRK